MMKFRDIKMYESPSCPKGSFYFADAQQLEKIKEFDKIFKRAQKIDEQQAILNLGLIKLDSDRREVRFE